MTTKKLKKSTKKPIQSINELLEQNDNDITKLTELSKSNNVNITSIMDEHSKIKKNLDVVSKKINKFKKQLYSTNNKEESPKTITDIEYEQYTTEIHVLSEQIENTTDVEKMLDIYEKIKHNVLLCEQYLNSKQTNIVYCD